MKRNFLTLMAGALMLGMSSMSAHGRRQDHLLYPGRPSRKSAGRPTKPPSRPSSKPPATTTSRPTPRAPPQAAADIEGLITQKAATSFWSSPSTPTPSCPSFQAAADAGVKMIAYDVLFEDPERALRHLRQRGRGPPHGQDMLEKGKPEGNFAFIKGDKGDPNATFLFQGMMEVLKPNMDAGKIKNVCETFTDGWKPDDAQKNMEQCLTSTSNKVDAVLSENDGMAGGVVAALEAQGLAGTVPVTGQDGDQAALNRVALGTQIVSVWKNARDLGKVAAEVRQH